MRDRPYGLWPWHYQYLSIKGHNPPHAQRTSRPTFRFGRQPSIRDRKRPTQYRFTTTPFRTVTGPRRIPTDRKYRSGVVDVVQVFSMTLLVVDVEGPIEFFKFWPSVEGVAKLSQQEQWRGSIIVGAI